MALAEGKRGLWPVGKGSQNFVAQDDYSGFGVSEILPRYYLANYNGLLFHFSSGSITGAAANVSPLPAGTGIPIIALWNPISSGKNAVITKVGATTLSGTPGGPLLWNYASWTTPTTATLSTPVSGIMNGTAASAMRVYSGGVTTGSLVGVFYKHAADTGILGATLTAGGVLPAEPFYEDVGGDVIIPPGTWGALALFAAGTSHVFQAGVSWLEVPV